MQKRVFLTAVGALVLMLALASTAARVSGASAAPNSSSGAATFTDPVGDVSGTDITAVTVSDVAASGLITVAATVTAVQPSAGLMVFLDTDKNASTGSPTSGCEYALGWSQVPGDWGWDVVRWSGSDWQSTPNSPTYGFSRSGDVLTWTLNKSDIGAPSEFNFYLVAISLDAAGNAATRDTAPDNGEWSYTLSTVPPPPPPVAVVKPVIGKPTLTPARTVAGKRVSVAFPVTRSDTGAALTVGTMICDPSVTGKVIPHAEQFTNGTARLTFVIPKSAKGKLLKVRLTIKSGTQSASTIATFRVAAR